MSAAELAATLVAPIIGAITEWLSGRAPEPPQLIHLGLSQLELADLRQRAAAAKLLNPGA